MKRILFGTFVGSVLGAIIGIAFVVPIFLYLVEANRQAAVQVELSWDVVLEYLIGSQVSGGLCTSVLSGMGFGAIVGTLVKGFQHLAESNRMSLLALQREIGDLWRSDALPEKPT